MLSSPATRALDTMGIAYRLHRHPGPVLSLEQAAGERGLEPGQIIRSLVFRLEDGSFVLVLTPGPGQVSWPRLRRALGVTRLTTATADEVRRVTGFEPGTVSPFGLATELRILADRGILAREVVSLGAGLPNAGLILESRDLGRALKFELGDFAEAPPAG